MHGSYSAYGGAKYEATDEHGECDSADIQDGESNNGHNQDSDDNTGVGSILILRRTQNEKNERSAGCSRRG